MPDTVQCTIHGETQQAFVCSHLAEQSHGLGFNREDPSADDPFPDAWCDNCELIRATHDGWNDESEKLTTIKLLCSGCYERTRIRNTKPNVTLDDLAGLQWKCGSCEEWHTGPMLDVGFDSPHYWPEDHETGSRWTVLASGAIDSSCGTFLDADYCAVDNESFFVRGVLEVPIVGTGEDFRWGIWGSLSRVNFETLIRADHSGECIEKREMFSWLSTSIPNYSETLSLKMTVSIREPGWRPLFILERSDHPLAKEFYEGITPERVKEIMFRALPPQPE